MRIFSTICRFLLGAIFLIFGLNGFFLFIPVPPMAEPAQNFMMALINTGYMLYFWKSIEVVSGALLIFNRYVPFALAILSPIVANIFMFHLFLDFRSMPIAAALLLMEVFLIWVHRKYFASLFVKRTEF